MKLSPKYVDHLSDGRGTLQRSVLENAPSSLFILFRPEAIQSQERLRFFDPVRQIHVDDRIRAKILGEGSSKLCDPGRQPGQGALVVRAQSFSARTRRFASQMRLRRTSWLLHLEVKLDISSV